MGRFLLIIISFFQIVHLSVLLSAPQIKKGPENSYVVPNSAYTLNCEATGDPKPTIVWYRNYNKILFTANSFDQFDETTGRLKVPVQLDASTSASSIPRSLQTGLYFCNATNSLGSVVSTHARLTLAYMLSSFKKLPQIKNAYTTGERVILHCEPPQSEPSARVTWFKNGQEIIFNTLNVQSTEGAQRYTDGFGLLFDKIRKEDSGKYYCQAQNQILVTQLNSPEYNIQVFNAPRFLETPPSNMVVKEGDYATFNCKYEGDEHTSVSFARIGIDKFPLHGNLSAESNSLTVGPLKIYDSGFYQCILNNRVGSINVTWVLDVQSKPSFLATPTNVNATLGSSVSFHCAVTGNPKPELSWRTPITGNLDLMPPLHNDRIRIFVNGTLTIDNVQKEDEGAGPDALYRCFALSSNGAAASQGAKLYVDAPPLRMPLLITRGPYNVTLRQNESLRWPCKVGIPFSSLNDKPLIASKYLVRWFRNGTELRPAMDASNGRMQMDNNNTLYIRPVYASDAGWYECVVDEAQTGGQQQQQQQAQSIISGDTRVYSMGGILRVLQASEPWLSSEMGTPGESGSRVRPKVKLLPAPSKPMLDTNQITEKTVTLEFRINSTAEDVRVEYFSPDMKVSPLRWQTALIATESTQGLKRLIHVFSLQPNTRYYFIVRAVNKEGYSSPSPPSDLVVTKLSQERSTEIEQAMSQAATYLDPNVAIFQTKVKLTFCYKGKSSHPVSFLVKFLNLTWISAARPSLTLESNDQADSIFRDPKEIEQSINTQHKSQARFRLVPNMLTVPATPLSSECQDPRTKLAYPSQSVLLNDLSPYTPYAAFVYAQRSDQAKSPNSNIVLFTTNASSPSMPIEILDAEWVPNGDLSSVPASQLFFRPPQAGEALFRIRYKLPRADSFNGPFLYCEFLVLNQSNYFDKFIVNASQIAQGGRSFANSLALDQTVYLPIKRHRNSSIMSYITNTASKGPVMHITITTDNLVHKPILLPLQGFQGYQGGPFTSSEDSDLGIEDDDDGGDDDYAGLDDLAYPYSEYTDEADEDEAFESLPLDDTTREQDDVESAPQADQLGDMSSSQDPNQDRNSSRIWLVAVLAVVVVALWMAIIVIFIVCYRRHCRLAGTRFREKHRKSPEGLLNNHRNTLNDGSNTLDQTQSRHPLLKSDEQMLASASAASAAPSTVSELHGTHSSFASQNPVTASTDLSQVLGPSARYATATTVGLSAPLSLAPPPSALGSGLPIGTLTSATNFAQLLNSMQLTSKLDGDKPIMAENALANPTLQAQLLQNLQLQNAGLLPISGIQTMQNVARNPALQNHQMALQSFATLPNIPLSGVAGIDPNNPLPFLQLGINAPINSQSLTPQQIQQLQAQHQALSSAYGTLSGGQLPFSLRPPLSSDLSVTADGLQQQGLPAFVPVPMPHSLLFSQPALQGNQGLTSSPPYTLNPHSDLYSAGLASPISIGVGGLTAGALANGTMLSQNSTQYELMPSLTNLPQATGLDQHSHSSQAQSQSHSATASASSMQTYRTPTHGNKAQQGLVNPIPIKPPAALPTSVMLPNVSQNMVPISQTMPMNPNLARNPAIANIINNPASRMPMQNPSQLQLQSPPQSQANLANVNTNGDAPSSFRTILQIDGLNESALLGAQARSQFPPALNQWTVESNGDGYTVDGDDASEISRPVQSPSSALETDLLDNAYLMGTLNQSVNLSDFLPPPPPQPPPIATSNANRISLAPPNRPLPKLTTSAQVNPQNPAAMGQLYDRDHNHNLHQGQRAVPTSDCSLIPASGASTNPKGQANLRVPVPIRPLGNISNSTQMPMPNGQHNPAKRYSYGLESSVSSVHGDESEIDAEAEAQYLDQDLDGDDEATTALGGESDGESEMVPQSNRPRGLRMRQQGQAQAQFDEADRAHDNVMIELTEFASPYHSGGGARASSSGFVSANELALGGQPTSSGGLPRQLANGNRSRRRDSKEGGRNGMSTSGQPIAI